MFHKIEMLKAGSGDCLWIECGANPQKPFLLVIDGGNDDKMIVARLKQLRTANQPINLWIVTHTDDDHVRGVLNMASYGLVQEVWFNAPKSKRATKSRLLSYRQGDQLADILRSRAGQTRWNDSIFGGAPVQLDSDPESGFIEYPLPNEIGGMTILGPTTAAVDALFKNWTAKTLGEREEEEQPAPERKPLTQSMIETLSLSRDKTSDRSVTNAACIMILLEFKGPELRRYLLAGDAPPATVLAAVNKLKGTGKRLRLDGFKLSHHASDRSVSKALLQALDCRDYYISTNGLKHGLPNDAAIAKSILIGKAHNLFFNYEEVGSRWAQYATQTGGKLKVHLPKSGDDYVLLASHRTEPKTTNVWTEPVIRPNRPVLTGLDINVTTVGDKLKVCFKAGQGAELTSWEIGVAPTKQIVEVSQQIRSWMESLAEEWPERSKFTDELAKVASAGRFLHGLLFGPSEFAQRYLADAQPKTSIAFRTQDIAIPAPFIYSPSLGALDPKAFWAYRYSVSSPFKLLPNKPNSILLDLLSYVGVDDYEPVYPSNFGSHHDYWRTFEEEWRRTSNCLSHFFCHANAGALSSRGHTFDLGWYLLADVASQRKNSLKGPDLLFLNACNTQELLSEHENWRSTLESEPFHGFIGTEAAVNQSAAREFAKAFFGHLAQGADVQDAFELARHQTWPASLYYSMYLNPELASKMKLATAAHNQENESAV